MVLAKRLIRLRTSPSLGAYFMLQSQLARTSPKQWELCRSSVQIYTKSLNCSKTDSQISERNCVSWLELQEMCPSPSPSPPPSFISCLSFHFSRGQNQESRSLVFLCSETARKRLLRRLRQGRLAPPLKFSDLNQIPLQK